MKTAKELNISETVHDGLTRALAVMEESGIPHVRRDDMKNKPRFASTSRPDSARARARTCVCPREAG